MGNCCIGRAGGGRIAADRDGRQWRPAKVAEGQSLAVLAPKRYICFRALWRQHTSMAQTLAQKLRIKEGMRLLTLHAPVGFLDSVGAPSDVEASPRLKTFDQIHWFVRDSAQLHAEATSVIGRLTPGVMVWIYYPKGSSGIQTDLTRDKGWDPLLAYKNLQHLVLISFDDTWSAFSMRLKEAGEKPRDASVRANGAGSSVRANGAGSSVRASRPADAFADPVTREVRLPPDLDKALRGNKGARAFFDSLSFTNKREYLEWIVSAKREETRLSRVEGTIERLAKGWKNPRNL